MICNSLQTLINYAIDKNIIEKADVYVVRNRLMNALKLTDWNCCEGEEYTDIEGILEPIIRYACENGIIEDTTACKDIFDTEIMGIITPMPREINAEFARRYGLSPIEATDWYYGISKDLNYVRAQRIAKDLKWPFECEYGTLDITINRSKPERIRAILQRREARHRLNIPNASFVPKTQAFGVRQTTLQGKISAR